MSSNPKTALHPDTLARVNQAGQLLVRAAAALDQVPAGELQKLEAIAGGPLPAGIRNLLQAALKADPSLAQPVSTIAK